VASLISSGFLCSFSLLPAQLQWGLLLCLLAPAFKTACSTRRACRLTTVTARLGACLCHLWLRVAGRRDRAGSRDRTGMNTQARTSAVRYSRLCLMPRIAAQPWHYAYHLRPTHLLHAALPPVVLSRRGVSYRALAWDALVTPLPARWARWLTHAHDLHHAGPPRTSAGRRHYWTFRTPACYTPSFEVAAFFAACHFTSSGGPPPLPHHCARAPTRRAPAHLALAYARDIYHRQQGLNGIVAGFCATLYLPPGYLRHVPTYNA